MDSSGTSYGFIYATDPITLLQQQIKLANHSNCEFQPSRMNNNAQDEISHPLHTKTINEVYNHIRQSIMASNDEDVYWNSNSSVGPLSFLGCLQMFTDKSKTSLKTKAMVAYPVHITFENFTNSFRRHLISKDLTIVGYLPTKLLSLNDYSDDDDEAVQTTLSSGRQTRLSILHNSLQSILSPLINITSKGFSCTDSTGIQLKCFPVLTSYCCDLPEAKDIAGVIAGVNTQFPCHRCLVHKSDLASTQCFPLRSAIELPNYRTPPRDLSMISIYSQSSFLEDCPLVPKIPCFDFYKLFRFELLHNFHLGISKLLKICIIYRLQSEELFTRTGSTNNTPRKFKAVQLSILRGINSLLATLERDYFVPGLTIDFSTSELGQQLNGLFLEHGLRGMLEGRHFKSLDMVFPFIGAFIDFCCDEVNEAPLTTLFSKYSKIMFTCLWKKEWTLSNIQSLRSEISAFQQLFIDVFQQHHPSGLRTLKFHLLNHLADDIEETSGLQYVEAGTYESAHQSFKKHHRQTSMRHSTAFEETLKRMEYHKNLSRLNGINHVYAPSSSRRKKVSPELGAVLVRDGYNLSLLEYKTFIDSVAAIAQTHTEESRTLALTRLKASHSRNVINLYQQLGDEASSSFLNLISEFLNENGSSCGFGHVQLTIVKSAYLVGGLKPTLEHYNEEIEQVEYNPSYQRQIQRIFATNNFGSAGKQRFSYVTLESSEENFVWFSKLIALLRVKPIDIPEPLQCALVRYMDTTNPTNNIDRALDSVCLRWSTDDGIDYTNNPIPLTSMENVTIPAPFFGLVDASSIYSSVHVIRRNIPHPPFIPKTHWMFHRFAVNQFYHNREEKEYNE